jgi:hypothetical protein
MFLPQSTYCSEGVANFNVIRIMMQLIIIIMTIENVEQRPGWGEHVQWLNTSPFSMFHPSIIKN